MSQDALGLLKHLKTARARWPFPDAPLGLSLYVVYWYIISAFIEVSVFVMLIPRLAGCF